MKRRLLNLMTALSLVLCLAMVALWVRSHWRADIGSWAAQTYETYQEMSAWRLERWMIISSRGEVEFIHTDHYVGRGRRTEAGFIYRNRPADENARAYDPRLSRRLGFEMKSWDANQIVRVPHGLLVAGFAALPVWRAYGVRKRRCRARSGLCSACGYDLRATPGKCPECGTASSGRVAPPPGGVAAAR